MPECPHCGKEIAESAHRIWARAVVILCSLIAIVATYNITLLFFVGKYDADELRDIVLLFINAVVILLGGTGAKKGWELLSKKLEGK